MYLLFVVLMVLAAILMCFVVLVQKALDDGYKPNEITDKALSAAMNVVGKDFGAKKIFLPQVMLSAEAMREAFLKIKEYIPPCPYR